MRSGTGQGGAATAQSAPTGLAPRPAAGGGGTESMEAFAAHLRAHGLRVTPQRQLIYEIVANGRQHVTADDVQRRLAERMPSISLPTVYAALDLFVELGVLRKVALPGGPTMYDSGVGVPHTQMVCSRCRCVFDLDIPPVSQTDIDAAASAGFLVDDGDLVLHGVCASCRAKESVASRA